MTPCPNVLMTYLIMLGSITNPVKQPKIVSSQVSFLWMAFWSGLNSSVALSLIHFIWRGSVLFHRFGCFCMFVCNLRLPTSAGWYQCVSWLYPALSQHLLSASSILWQTMIPPVPPPMMMTIFFLLLICFINFNLVICQQNNRWLPLSW